MSEFSNLTLAKRFGALDVSETFAGYSGVEIVVDSDTTYFAGTRSGRVLTIENPWGTQAQADRLLARLQGYQYQPYSATDALLDPAAELGDGVSLNGLYGGLFSIVRKYSRLMAADIKAPQDEEIDHEYPYEPKADREITRKFSAIESEFAIQSNEISAKVSQVGGANNSVSWSLKADAWRVYANGAEVFKVDRNGATVTGKITATSGTIGGFDIGSSSISYNKATYGGNRTGVYFGTSGIQLGAANGDFFQASVNGKVKCANIELSGTLKIGDNTISANNLRLGASRANSGYSGWNTAKTNWDNALGSGIDGTFSAASINARSSFYFAGKTAVWKTMTVSNQYVNFTIYYLGYR